MALTLQEIIAKRQSMGPNATNVEARQALMATPAVNPAPTTPIVPTPIPTQAPVMDQMAGKTVAERQAIRSGQPAPVTTTPPPTTQTTPQVDTPAPVTTPVQPALVEPVKAPVKPVTPKVEAPIDYTQAQGREQEITNNVKGFIDSGMTPDQAKQASGYNEASPEKKAIIDGIITGASQGALLNEKDALNALISGVSVPKQNTQAFRNAEFKANKFRKFNSMTPTQLLDNLKMGEIGSEMDQLLSQNPNYAQAKQKLNELQKITNLNKTMSNLVTGAKGTEVPTITPEQDEEDISAKLMKKFGLDDANASAFAEFIATDEEMAENKAKLLVNKNQLSNVNRQIADATTLLNQGIKDLKSQYPDMSASGIITLMGSRLGEFNDAITNLNSTKTLLQADIKDEMDLAKSAYDAKSEDIKAQNTIRSNLALNEAKSLQEKADAEAALNDPATALSGVIKEFTDMGIPTTQSLQTKVADAEKFIAQGGTLAGYIDKMRSDYMNKPEYKTLSDYNKRKLAPEVAKPVNPDWKLDPATGQYYDANANVNPSTTIAKNDATKKYGTTPAVRNFNPGNIMDTGFGGRKVAGERFTVFDSPQEGFNALVSKIKNVQAGNSKVYSPEMTLLQYISKYAPASDNNNPTGYANAIAKNLGITSNTKIKDIDATKLAEEHARHEDGNSYRMLKDLGVIGGGTKQTGSIASLAQYMKDNQKTGAGYSDTDVKRFDAKIDRFAQNGDEKGMAIAYRDMLMTDNDFKKSFDDTKTFTTALDTVQKMVSDYEKAGKDTNALKKIAETVGRKLGLTTDTALAQLQTQMGTTMANYIKSISGTAASDAEVARLMGNMANIGNVSELNTAIVSTVKQNAMNGIKSMIDTRMYGMPEELKPQVFGDIYNTTQSNSKLSALMQALANIAKNAPKQ